MPEMLSISLRDFFVLFGFQKASRLQPLTEWIAETSCLMKEQSFKEVQRWIVETSCLMKEETFK